MTYCTDMGNSPALIIGMESGGLKIFSLPAMAKRLYMKPHEKPVILYRVLNIRL